MNGLKMVGARFARILQSRTGKLATLAVVTVVAASPTFAAGEVTIPVIGVSVQDYISAGITLMGTVAGTAVGGYAAFLVVRKGLRWLGRALG